MKKPTKHSMTRLADAAFEQAAAKVIERAKGSGTPVILWENHEVKEVEPQKGIEGRKKGSHRRTGR